MIHKKKLALFLAVCTMVTSVFSVPASANSYIAEATQTEFHATFDDRAFGDSPSDGAKVIESSGTKAVGSVFHSLYGKYKVSSISGTAAHNSNETIDKLIDGDPNTKYLSNYMVPSVSSPVIIQMEMNAPVIVRAYSFTSANDASERDPENWTIKGSNNDADWTVIDTKTGESFASRFAVNLYQIQNETAYKYYKIEITKNRGGSTNLTQIADIDLAEAYKITGTPDPYDNLLIQVLDGPSSVFVTGDGNSLAKRGWTDASSLAVSGELAKGDALDYQVIFDNVNIAVNKDTELSYMFFPSYADTYDFNYTSMFMAVDLEFTDGTFLRNLNALDQNGIVISPIAQGESKILQTRQWNHIYGNIGKVAVGKTIKNILIRYENPNGIAGKKITAFFDDIKISTVAESAYKRDNLAEYVNILRGTNDSGGFSRGLVGPMVTVPHGFNFWAPATNQSSNVIYNYHKTPSTTLEHIQISHEPSIWVGDRGTYAFMANTSISDIPNVTRDMLRSRGAEFEHDNETAHAHYYGVTFNDTDTKAGGVKMEVTPTDHAAALRFTFPEGAGNRNVILDSNRDSSNASLVFNADGSFDAYSSHTSNGMKRMYIYGKFDVIPTATRVANSASGSGIASFAQGTKTVTLKVATSFISKEQAKKNLEHEISEADTFDTVKAKAMNIWNEKLDIVEIEGASYDQMVTFYSNMYRLFAYPNSLSENTGTAANPKWEYTSPYYNRDNSTSNTQVEGKLYYNNGFWDTYRTTWAAYALFVPEFNTELLNGLVQHYNDQGWVPRWIAPGGTNSMVGTSSDVVFGDAMYRNQNFDYKNAYLSAVRNASAVSSNLTNGGRTSLETSIFLGYTPNSTGEGMSWALEGYINDFGIAKMAKALMDLEPDKESEAYRQLNDEYIYFINRAKNYVNMFDSREGGWFRGKSADGNFPSISGFDPRSWWGQYTEQNAWNYAFHAPQDAQGLANLYGGRAGLAAKLDKFFAEPNNDLQNSGIHEMLEAREVKMGQYGHNNQPSHHIPYMYNYAGQPAKTQEKVRDILDRLYVGESIGQGYLGDEDNGEMSAWYILSALGLYPVNMGSGEFAIGSPLFTKATINPDDGTKIEIIANNNSKENIYVQNVKLDGVNHNRTYFNHNEIAKPGTTTIEFTMGNQPSNWGTGEDAVPPSITVGDETPQIMTDLTSPNAALATSLPAADYEADAIYTDNSGVTNLKNLIDNNSSNVTRYPNNISSAAITYYFANPKAINMYTITSSSTANRAPKNFRLTASNDGESWITLDSRENQEFRWARYLRPFTFDNNVKYKYYRLEILEKGDGNYIEIAEIELMANPLDSITKADLAAAIAEGKSYDNPSVYGKATYDALLAIIEKAEAVYENDSATKYQISKAIEDIGNGIKGLKPIRNAKDRLEAETFDGASSGIVAQFSDGVNNIGGVRINTWALYQYVDFGGEWEHSLKQILLRHAGQNGDVHEDSRVEIRIDSLDGQLIGTVSTPATGSSWATYVIRTFDLDIPADVTGVHDVYLLFKGSGNYVVNLDYVDFVFNEDNLEDIIKKISEFVENADASDYTEESFKALTDALIAAKAVAVNPEATKEERSTAKNNLTNAFDGLIEAEKEGIRAALNIDTLNSETYVKAKISNYDEEPVNVILITATYGDNGKMTGYSVENISVASGQTENIQRKVEGDNIKAFLWNADSLIPLCAEAIYNNR